MNLHTTKCQLFLVLGIAIIFPFSSMVAQAFTVSPSNELSVVVYENSTEDLRIDLTNTSGAPIVYQWEFISNTLDPNWTQLLCDYASCYTTIPGSGTMSSVDTGGIGFLKLTIGVKTFVGSGSAIFKVWASGDTASAQILTFNFDAIVGMDEPDFAQSIQVFPNPVTDVLNVRNMANNNELGLLEIADITGKVIVQEKLDNGELITIDYSTFLPGLYIVRFSSGSQSTSKKILKLN